MHGTLKLNFFFLSLGFNTYNVEQPQIKLDKEEKHKRPLIKKKLEMKDVH